MGKSTKSSGAEGARFGAMLAGKGLTPDQAADFVQDHVEPVLQEALRLVEAGVPVDSIRFTVE